MYLIFTKNLVPSIRTSEDILSQNGFIKLLAQGAILNQSQINRLKSCGLPFIYINDNTTKKNQEVNIAVYMTNAEFKKGYHQTIDKIIYAFEHIKKFKEVPIAEMQELIDQKIFLFVETIAVLEHLHNIRCYSEYTFNHSLNVAILAGILGKWCNYQGVELKNLILTGLLHDIGKLFVPLSILNKPNRLSNKEFTIIKNHPQESYQLIKNAQISENVKLGIWQHHECLDGSGYPLRLIGDEICSEAKIIAIADIYDAITSDRVYCRKMTPFEALDLLSDYMFKKLESNACLTFIENVRNYFTGSNVILSNGVKAKIVAFSANCFTKPVVYMQNDIFLDLQNEDLYIKEVQPFP